MEDKFMITPAHSENLPIIRIKKTILENFKSVEYGQIELTQGLRADSAWNASDILGIYGQNGSGKTSFIEALSILKQLLTGMPVHTNYADCISLTCSHATLTFFFDFLYPDGTAREVSYSVNLCREPIVLEEGELPGAFAGEDDEMPKWKVGVFGEKVCYYQKETGSRKSFRTIIDTASRTEVFTPAASRRILAGTDRQTAFSLAVRKNLAREKSQSFVFMRDTLGIFRNYGEDVVHLQILLELRRYAYQYLFVVDSRSSGLIRLNLVLPLYTTQGVIMLNLNKPTPVAKHSYHRVREQLCAISTVLGQLVPGLRIDIQTIGQTMDKRGDVVDKVMLIAERGGLRMPLRDESDGVRKIISVLSLIIAAFNQESVTVAIDEFDAGIFEYLLGEILQAIEESGHGQFIFTSHNLRPLEVIHNRFLCFTTTNPQNRYIRLKHIGSGGNLRDAYFRELIVDEQDEQVYNRTKRFQIVSALRKAGNLL